MQHIFFTLHSQTCTEVFQCDNKQYLQYLLHSDQLHCLLILKQPLHHQPVQPDEVGSTVQPEGQRNIVKTHM